MIKLRKQKRCLWTDLDVIKKETEESSEFFSCVNVLGEAETCSASGEICGTPSSELIEQLKGSPVWVNNPFRQKLGDSEDVVAHYSCASA